MYVLKDVFLDKMIVTEGPGLMTSYNLKWALLLFALLAACLNGCARRHPTSLDQLTINRQLNAAKEINPATTNTTPPAQKPPRAFTPYEEIVVSLVSDSLDLLATNISSKVYDVILNGIEIPDQHDVIDKSVLTSQRKEDIAFVAGLIVQHVYGDSIGKETVIPQVILFHHQARVTFADITAVKAKLSLSENRNMDAYSACLSLLVNTLSGNYGIEQKSREGLYLRDSKNNLYFHKDLKFMGNTSN